MDKTIEHMRVDLVKVEELRELLTARGKVLVTTMEGKRVQALPDCLKRKLKDPNGEREELEKAVVEVFTPQPSRPMYGKSPCQLIQLH